jgi:serine/threonine protein kinase
VVPTYDIGVEGVRDAEPIGSGGNAVVYRAFDADHDRWVAVKLLRGVGDEAELRRFDRERKAMGRLSEHEGIVTIHSSGINTRGEPFLVMSLLEGGSLQDRIDDHGPVPWAEAVDLMRIVARTVHSAHQQNVVHRDLKPANIMLSTSGYPLVADFGIAKHVDASASLQSTAITMTPAYSPPEVVQGAPASLSADVYALGATLFALIAGSPPFMTGDQNLFSLLLRVAEDPVRDLRPDGVPDHVCTAIEQAMAKKP